MDFPVDNTWRLMPSRVSSFPQSKPILESNYSQLQAMQDFGHMAIPSALSKQQQQHSLFRNEFGSPEPVKQEGQSLRPFFDEWPKTRGSWSDLEEERSNRTSFSTTQLSISIPMSSSDFSGTSSRSPNGNSNILLKLLPFNLSQWTLAPRSLTIFIWCRWLRRVGYCAQAVIWSWNRVLERTARAPSCGAQEYHYCPLIRGIGFLAVFYFILFFYISFLILTLLFSSSETCFGRMLGSHFVFKHVWIALLTIYYFGMAVHCPLTTV